MALLEVDRLQVRFRTPEGWLRAVNDLSFTLEAGATLGIVGESGSGKSQMALAIMGLLAQNAQVEGGVRFEGQELLQLLHQLEDLRLDRDVERGRGLVGNEQVRPQRQCDGDHDALALPTGQLERIRARHPLVIVEADRQDRKSTRLNSSHIQKSRMPSSA